MDILNPEELDKWNSHLLELHTEKNWKDIIEMESLVPPEIMLDIRKRYLWAWPHIEDLIFIADLAKEQR